MNEATRSRLLLLAMLAMAAALVTIPACIALGPKAAVDLPPMPPAFAERTVQRYAVQMPPEEVPHYPVLNDLAWDYVYDTDPDDIEFVLTDGSPTVPVEDWPITIATEALSAQRVSLSGTLQLVTLRARHKPTGIMSDFATK